MQRCRCRCIACADMEEDLRCMIAGAELQQEVGAQVQVHSAVEVLCRGAEVQVQVQVEVQIWRCWGRLQAQRQRCRCAVVDVLKRCRVS